jgi:hypothetical protein
MPGAAVKREAVNHITPLSKIGEKLIELCY